MPPVVDIKVQKQPLDFDINDSVFEKITAENLAQVARHLKQLKGQSFALEVPQKQLPIFEQDMVASIYSEEQNLVPEVKTGFVPDFEKVVTFHK